MYEVLEHAADVGFRAYAGFDINCGVRLRRTSIGTEEARARLRRGDTQSGEAAADGSN